MSVSISQSSLQDYDRRSISCKICASSPFNYIYPQGNLVFQCYHSLVDNEFIDRHVICHLCDLIIPKMEAVNYPQENKLEKGYRAMLCLDCAIINDII